MMSSAAASVIGIAVGRRVSIASWLFLRQRVQYTTVQLITRISRKRIFVAVTIVVIMSLAYFYRLYAVRESNIGAVLWNSDEAYVFLHVVRQGYDMSSLRYPWVLFKAVAIGGFAAAEGPDEINASVIVIHITPSGVERHEVDVPHEQLGTGPHMYTPIDDHIYANFPAIGGLCRWAGDHFELATREERERLHNELIEPDIDGGTRDWSKRRFSTGLFNGAITAEVGQKVRIFVQVSGRSKSSEGQVVVTLDEVDKKPQTLWTFDARRGLISTSEYRRLFEK